jgi:hypothetical protein
MVSTNRLSQSHFRCAGSSVGRLPDYILYILARERIIEELYCGMAAIDLILHPFAQAYPVAEAY